MNQIVKRWLEEHKISSHSIAVAIVGAATAYTTNLQIQGFVNQIIGAHPTWIINLTALCALVLNYSGTHNTQGQVAQVAKIPAPEYATAVKAVAATEVPVTPFAPPIPNPIAVAVTAAAKADPPKP